MNFPHFFWFLFICKFPISRTFCCKIWVIWIPRTFWGWCLFVNLELPALFDKWTNDKKVRWYRNFKRDQIKLKKWHYSCNIVTLLKSNNSGRIFDGTKSAMGFDILMQEVNQSCITDEMIDAVVVLTSITNFTHDWVI